MIWWTGSEKQCKQVSCSLPLSFPCSGESPVPWGILADSVWLQMTFWICLFRWRLDKKQEQPSGRINGLRQAGSNLLRQDWAVSTNLSGGSLPSGPMTPLGVFNRQFPLTLWKKKKQPDASSPCKCRFQGPCCSRSHLVLRPLASKH